MSLPMDQEIRECHIVLGGLVTMTGMEPGILQPGVPSWYPSLLVAQVTLGQLLV